MRTMYLVFSFLFGASVGSFLNVVAWRVPRGESIVRPASRCTSCGTPIRWFDNVPVLSWFLLRGRCRSCGAAFSFRYALVELVTGLLFLAVVMRFGQSWLSLKYAVFVSLLVCTVLTDIDHWIVLDSVSLGGTAVGLGFALLPGAGKFLPHLITSVSAFLLFLIIRTVAGMLLKRRPGYTLPPEGHESEAEEFQGGMGWGDIKLAAMTGAFLGPALTGVALFLSFLAGGLAGTAFILAGRNRRVPVPFGPFLAIGSIVTVFAGRGLWEAYLRLGASF